MKVLLTGHQGYIGTRLSPILLEAGHSVTGLDSDLLQGCTFGDGVPEIPSIACDVREVSAAHFAGFDLVIHLAGLSSDPMGDYDPGLTWAVNEDASIRLAGAAKDAGVRRFLLASSCSVYGTTGGTFTDEQGKLEPITAYGRSKAGAERGILRLARSGFSPTVLRVPTTYGSSPRMRFDLLVNRLAGWAFTTGEIPLHGEGAAWRPLAHVEDVARAFLAAAEAPTDAVHRHTFNVGSTAENYQVRDVAAVVGEVIPGTRLSRTPGRGSDRRSYRVDCNLISKALPGFKPAWTVRRGIEELCMGFHRAGLTVSDLKGPRFERVSHVRELIDTGVLDRSLRWTAGVSSKSATSAGTRG